MEEESWNCHAPHMVAGVGGALGSRCWVAGGVAAIEKNHHPHWIGMGRKMGVS